MNSELNINPIIKKILLNRGIIDEADIAEYMSRTPGLTYDPFLMKGMEEATELVIKYAREGRCIYIYGDYDSDGINSVALLTTFLSEMTDNVRYYIPSRFEEGYGLNMKAVKKLYDSGAELIITADCGCVSYDEVEYIKELGMEVIVTDHHNIDKRAADCIMLNPKQKDDEYPFAYLCGCGVAFKLTQAICRKTGISRQVLNSMLDLVGIATIGDIVPLVDENRTLVKYGMDRIKRRQRAGLNILLDRIRINPVKIRSADVAFGIVPHLNSSGRLKHAGIGVELLSGGEDARLCELSEELASLNDKRKALQDGIVKAAEAFIDENLKDDQFILYDAESSHEGVTGIAAGKLKDRYYRPVIIVTDTLEEGIVKGTGRSVPGVDLFYMLSKYESMFLRFGGHASACGFSMRREDVNLLRRGLNDDIAALLAQNPDLLTFTILPDAEISADDVTYELAGQIQLMEPFGAGNERPVFFVTDVCVKRVICMGSRNQYRKFKCVSPAGNLFDAVCFDENMEDIDAVEAGNIIDVMAETDINEWNGRSFVQLVLRKIEQIRNADLYSSPAGFSH